MFSTAVDFVKGVSTKTWITIATTAAVATAGTAAGAAIITQGQQGDPGINGADGANGKSAYELALDYGYKGTEEEWLIAITGASGQDGVDGEDGKDGASITNVYVDENLHLWVELSNGTKIDAGYVGVSTTNPTPTPPAPEYSNPTLVVGTVTAKAGDTVEIKIDIKNNPGIAGAKLIVSYGAKLTLTAATSGEAFADLDYTEPASLTSPTPFNWDSLNAEATNEGTVLTLTFNVANNVSAGEELDVTISYTAGDIYDVDLNDVTLDLVSGKIIVD